MNGAKSISYHQVDFDSPKVKRANEIVQCDLPVESFTTAYQKGKVLVGIYHTPCGKPCVFIEYNQE